MDNVVKSPKHYQIMPGVEVKDVRKALLDNAQNCVYNPTYNEVDYWSRAWEYLTRMWGKNGLEDAEKATVYLGWLIQSLKEKQRLSLLQQRSRNMPHKTTEEAYEQQYREDYDPT